MMHPIESAVRSPVKVTVGVLLVGLFGVIAAFRMPIQLTPEVETPTITVETLWRGASPQEVERQIVQEQEEYLKSVEGVTKMSSEATDGAGSVTLEFAVGTDMAEALLKVESRLQQVREYPVDADKPVVATSNLTDRPIAFFILAPRLPDDAILEQLGRTYPERAGDLDYVIQTTNPDLKMRRLLDLAERAPEISDALPESVDVSKLRKFAEDIIEARFERVTGVSNANVFGGREIEVQVILDPQRLAARELTLNDVRSALQARNRDTSAGDIWEGKRRWVIRTLGEYEDLDEIGGTIIATRDGIPIYVRDVAKVQYGYKKPDGVVRRYGMVRMAISVQRETGSNVLEVMRGLKVANAELNAGVLAEQGLQLNQVSDETDYINSAIGLVWQNILVGGSLTIAVLLTFLRSGRFTLVIALAIPISIIGTFLILNALGRSLNVISLAGLAFAVGMLVDNAVVVLENIERHFRAGDSIVRAAVRGAIEVWGAIVASTLTTLAVFIPVVFVEEQAGQLFRDIALAISAAVSLSLLVSVTVIPTFSSLIFRRDRRVANAHPDRRTHSRVGGGDDAEATRRGWGPIALADAIGRGFIESVVGLNAWLQRSILLRLVAVVVFVGASVGGTLWLMPKAEYLPNGNRNLVFGILLPPPGYNVDELSEIGDRIAQELKPYWDIDPYTGEPADDRYPGIKDFFYVARGKSLFMGLRCVDPLRAGELIPLVREVGAKEPGMIAIANQSSLFERGLGAGRSIDVEISGPDLNRLVALGRRVLGQVNQMIDDVQARPVPSLDLATPEMHVLPKWEQSTEMGVNATDLGYAVDALIDGAYSGDYYLNGQKIDMTILGETRFAERTQDLGTLPVATPEGQLIPLSSLAEIRLSSGPEQINHRERERAITIQVTPPPQVALEEAMARIEAEILTPMRAEGQLDPPYKVRLAGTADKLQDTWTALWFNLLLALLVTYLLMAALFEAWTYPLVIIFSVPLGAVGGFLGLAALNLYVLQPLDVLTMLGFVILIGTVVNNAILIVHRSLQLIREEGVGHREAILESVRTRIRPIFMTTATTVLGLLPLVLFPGAGSELYRGLGSVMLGGLVVSTLFTLVLIPTLFSLVLDAKAALNQGECLKRDEDDDLEADDEPPRNGRANGHIETDPHHVAEVPRSEPTRADADVEQPVLVAPRRIRPAHGST